MKNFLYFMKTMRVYLSNQLQHSIKNNNSLILNDINNIPLAFMLIYLCTFRIKYLYYNKT